MFRIVCWRSRVPPLKILESSFELSNVFRFFFYLEIHCVVRFGDSSKLKDVELGSIVLSEIILGLISWRS